MGQYRTLEISLGLLIVAKPQMPVAAGLYRATKG